MACPTCFFPKESSPCSSEPESPGTLADTVQFSSVAQSCPTFCNPVNCSMPGLPVHHQLPESTQTHVHRVGDAIQLSHPLLSPSPPAPNPSIQEVSNEEMMHGKVPRECKGCVPCQMAFSSTSHTVYYLMGSLNGHWTSLMSVPSVLGHDLPEILATFLVLLDRVTHPFPFTSSCRSQGTESPECLSHTMRKALSLFSLCFTSFKPDTSLADSRKIKSHGGAKILSPSVHMKNLWDNSNSDVQSPSGSEGLW